MPTTDDDNSFPLPDKDSPVVVWHNGAAQALRDLRGAALLPGAFNPVHRGHLQLRAAAGEFLGRPVLFELSIENVDKPRLDADQVRQRVNQMTEGPVLLTHAPLFADKARLFPDSWFVVGIDTAVRILDPRYYSRDEQLRDQFLQDLDRRQVKILVAGRVDDGKDTGEFRTRSQLLVDRRFRDLFVELPESAFRVDVSSTAIREQRGT